MQIDPAVSVNIMRYILMDSLNLFIGPLAQILMFHYIQMLTIYGLGKEYREERTSPMLPSTL